MLVMEVYNKAEWEITGRDDDTEGRARKSKFSVACCLRDYWHQEAQLGLTELPINNLFQLQSA